MRCFRVRKILRNQKVTQNLLFAMKKYEQIYVIITDVSLTLLKYYTLHVGQEYTTYTLSFSTQ